MPRPLQVDLGPFDLESGVRVMCDVGYLCANFSLPRPLCSRLTPDVCDRRLTSDAHHRLKKIFLTSIMQNLVAVYVYTHVGGTKNRVRWVRHLGRRRV